MGTREAAVVLCAILALIALGPAIVADQYHVPTGSHGAYGIAVRWEFVPPGYGTWTGYIVNSGLKWLSVDVYDNTSGVCEGVMHQRIRFAAYGAFPSGEVNTTGVVMAPNHTYVVSATPKGHRGSFCDIEDMFKLAGAPVAVFTTGIQGYRIDVDGSASYDPDGGSIESYAWSFGDGSTAVGPAASRPYDIGGTYTVVLFVKDDAGLCSRASEEVSMPGPSIPPPASIALSTLVITDPTSLTSQMIREE